MSPKRICLFSDGSGDTPEMKCTSNIVRLAEAVLPESSSGAFQQVFYDPGVGTAGLFDHISGFYFGAGIDVNIKQLYTELAMNYVEGDEVYLFGFSRGAYTVRSLASFIHTAGLVRRNGLEQVEEAFDLYYRKVGADSAEAQAFRQANGDRIPIKALVCFDTVGAMGFPLPLPWPLSAWDKERHDHHDMTLYPEVENAVHALSIDEERAKFMCEFMKAAPGRGESQVSQLYFTGFHAGVGGGDREEKELADMACRWVVEELYSRGCDLEVDMKKIGGLYYDVEPKTEFGTMRMVMKVLTGTAKRPVTVDSMHETAIRRYCRVENYRAKAVALKGLEAQILARGKELGYC